MEAFVTYDEKSSDLHDPQQFWGEIDDLLKNIDGVRSSKDCTFLQSQLASFFALCDAYYDIHLDQGTYGDEALTRLIGSPLLTQASLPEISDALITLVTSATSLPTLHLLFDALLLLGHHNPAVYKSKLAATQLIPRLVHHFWAARYAEQYLGKEVVNKELHGGEGGQVDWNIQHVRSVSMGDSEKQRTEARDRRLQIRLRDEAVVLLYEVCRAQRLEAKNMRAIDATFVNHLFDLVEASRHWQDDTYNYQLIKLIVALNEQFMVSGIEAATKPGSTGNKRSSVNHSNTVMTVLRTRLNASNTFAENIIWMLNRASSLNAEDVCMQLLVLKLLYLLFTTRETAHYFYLNDLKVLVDIFVRELHDLSEESESLRHTYLRVLHPLLTNTQLLTYPYKRKEIQRLLQGLVSRAHLRDISPTTRRLVERCLAAEWCVDLDAGVIGSKDGLGASNRGAEAHTLAFQPVSGGPHTIAHASIETDDEGVSIMVDGRPEPLRLVASSAGAKLAVATASIPDSRVVDVSGAGLKPVTRTREKRVLSVGAQSPQMHRPRLPSPSGRNALEGASLAPEDGLTSRRNASSSSTLTVRRDLGQRASSARTAPVTPPFSGQRMVGGLRESQDIESDEEAASRWSQGVGSNSWHIGLADDPRSATSQGDTQVRYGSPLSQDSSEQYYSMSASLRSDEEVVPSVQQDGVANIPQVEQILQEEGLVRPRIVMGGESDRQNSSSIGSSGPSRRRRPPAPPMSDGGLASRKERRALLSSTSETSLTPSGAATSHNSLPRKFDMTSLPNSPRSGSLPSSSREPSPPPDHQTASVARRRRPPPPPVDRSTKGSRTPIPQQQSEASPYDPIGPSEGETAQPALERAMNYLYVSDGGYGW